MNWLAHILLSKRDIEYQIGNFLADPLKGKAWEGASVSLKHGMAMHKSIDMFTDTHAIVSQSKARLGKKGYLKGVVIDLLYDHFLSANWSTYVSVAQTSFLEIFYTEARLAADSYPSVPKKIVLHLINSNRLANYLEFDGFVEALYRINDRLSPRIKAKDSALNYIDVTEQQYPQLKNDFDLFFPELVTFYKQHDLGSIENNYLL